MKLKVNLQAAAAMFTVAGTLAGGGEALAQADTIFVPALVYRTGAYSPNGAPWADGFVDYLKLVNERDGGVNGVKISYEECEFGYATDRGVECYERLKSKKPVAINPLSTGVTFALTEKAPGDKIPIFSTGYGRADSADGSVFKWNFPLLGTYWSAADILLQHVKKKEGGSLKGKKITLVHADIPYGKEPIPYLEEQAKKEGYVFKAIPVTMPGVEQKATWLQVRQDRPDYVFIWGWGVMNSTAIKEAIAVGYPRAQMYGVWWSAAEPDVLPAEMAAKGYNGLALQASSEKNASVHKDLMKFLYDKGKGTAAKKEDVGSVLYNRGMMSAMLVIESIRVAQAKTKKKIVTGEDVRWGAENLNIDVARIKAIGFEGILQPIRTSCGDHEGVHRARIHTWDGSQWSYTSEWYDADVKKLKPFVAEHAKKYAAEKKIEQRDCSKES